MYVTIPEPVGGSVSGCTTNKYSGLVACAFATGASAASASIAAANSAAEVAAAAKRWRAFLHRCAHGRKREGARLFIGFPVNPKWRARDAERAASGAKKAKGKPRARREVFVPLRRIPVNQSPSPRSPRAHTTNALYASMWSAAACHRFSQHETSPPQSPHRPEAGLLTHRPHPQPSWLPL